MTPMPTRCATISTSQVTSNRSGNRMKFKCVASGMEKIKRKKGYTLCRSQARPQASPVNA